MASSYKEISGVQVERPSKLTKIFDLRFLLQFISIASLFIVWALLVRFNVYRFGLLPGPAEVLTWGIEWVQDKTFWIDVAFTSARVWGGVLTACLIAIPMGLMIGWNQIFSDFTFPMVEILRPIPGIAYIPVAILFLPWEEASTAFICFIGAFFPIIVNTITGVKMIDRNYFRAARCLGSNSKQVFWHVVVPGALPYISTGTALGMGIGWMASVAGEMISGKYGLGYRVWESYTLVRYPLIVVGMIVIGFLGLASSAAIRYATKRIVPWRKAMTESLDESITKR
jgi:NitT/TauT family transport system permease protein